MTQRFQKKAPTTSATEFRTLTAAQQRGSFDSEAEVAPDKDVTKDRSGQDYYTCVFSKCFSHNSFLEVLKEDIDKLRTCLETGESAEFDELSLHSSAVRKLVSPQSSLSFNAVGQDPFGLSMPAAPQVSSVTFAAEMIELYGMALLRDQSFKAIEDSTTSVENIVDDLLADLVGAGPDYLGPR